MVCSLGGAEREDMGQIGRTRMEEQKSMAKLVALMINKEGCNLQKKEMEGRRGNGDEGRT